MEVLEVGTGVVGEEGLASISCAMMRRYAYEGGEG